MFGEVVGIHVAFALEGENINFATPVDKLEPLLQKAEERKDDPLEEDEIPEENGEENTS